jgi:thioredoxin reductase (NADPH)
MDNRYDLIVIGAGPAGLTAAIYASKSNMKTIILEKGAPGGKMTLTHVVENWSGTESINGADLSINMFNHALASGAIYQYEDVTGISQEGNYIKVIGKENSYISKTLIIATGMREKKLGVKGEEELFGNGVSYCAVCDGTLFKGKEVVVVGAGNSAFEEAAFLSDIVKHVHVVHRSEKFRAYESVVDALKSKKNIT